MSFVVYDLVFLAVFTAIAVYFLYGHRRQLKRQGWVFLYHTNAGIILMEKWAKKYASFLRPLQYVVVGSGFVLLVSMTILLIKTTYDYVTSPYLAQAIKIPPLLPLFPYFPQIFKIETLFPPFYFTYFLVALAIVAVSHEFAHGLFARLNNVKIKSTGLAFFGPFFGAFVEQDDKDMAKIGKFPQMAILAAGTFANVIMTIIFGIVLWAFFSLSFSAGGAYFNSYSVSVINVSSIEEVNGVRVNSVDEIGAIIGEDLVNISAGSNRYFVAPLSLRTALEQDIPAITVYDDSPALNAKLGGAIVGFDGQRVTDLEILRAMIRERSPGDVVVIDTIQQDKTRKAFEITLGERDGSTFLGIGVLEPSKRGIGGFIRSVVFKIKDPFTYYEPVWGGDFTWFIYYLLWWIVMINVLVALFNMLPLGMLDGGRFFYLTLWGITGKEWIGKKAFAIATWFFLGLLALMMVRWVFIFF